MRGRVSGSRATFPRRRSELLQRIGGGLLWAVVVVLLLRGLAGVFARPEPTRSVRVMRPAVTAWPDDEARAFAADFARAYLTFSPRDTDAELRAVEAFVSPALSDSSLPELGAESGAQTVTAVTVARTSSIDPQHALITVAVTVGAGTRYLTVPLARDDRGGLVVDELPSFSAPPRRATLKPTSVEPISGSEQSALTEVASRFLRAYLAGDASGLAYLVPAGVRIAAPAPRSYELVDVVALAQGMAPAARVRELLVAVRVRELPDGALLTQRYRLRLVRRDRWYVADVNGSREG
jgi:hypothetical protein